MAIFSAIATGISSLFAGTFLASGVGAFLLKAAVGVGLNLLASVIAGKPEEPQFSVQGQLQTGGDVPRSFPVGWTATAGSLVYANTWGKAGKTPNAYFTQVIALSDLPRVSLAAFWVNGEKVTIDFDDTSYGDWGFPIKEYAKGDDNALWIKFYDGTQTVADAFLVNTVSSEGRPYEATRVGTGVAYAVVTAQVKEELFTGFPQFKFELNGVALYDPSKDTTAGGSGPQRWGNPSTWGGDGDLLPAVQLYNLLRGLTYNGTWFYGLQNLPAARLPVAHWIGEIAKCRATVNGPKGPEPKYRCGGEIQVGAQISEAVKAILTTAQARLSETGGIYKMHIGSSGAATYGITDADILSTEEQSFTPFFGLADTINGITATYPSPAEGWNAKVAPPRYSPEFEAEDGNRRLLSDVPLDFVPYKGQVQRLMKSALAEARRARRHTFVLPPQYWPLEAGDFITWTSARNGYATKKFRVDGVIDKENLDIVVDMTEVDPSDYDWNQDVDFRTEPDGRLDRKRPEPQPIIDWYAEPAAITDSANKQRRPAILLSWDGDVEDVRAVQFAVRMVSSGAVVHRGRTDEVEAGSILISHGLLPLTSYQVRGRYIPRSDRETLWSSWFPVTTWDIKLGADDIDIERLVDELEDWIGADTDRLEADLLAAAMELAARYRDVDGRIDAIMDYVAEQDFSNYADRQQIQTTLKSEIGDTRAEFDEKITVATSATGAVAERVSTLEVSTGNISSAVTNLATAMIDGDEALAQQISIVQVKAEDAAAAVLEEKQARIDADGAFAMSLNGVSSRLTTAEGAIVAGSTATSALETRVSTAEGKVTTQGAAITAIQSELPGKATVSAVNTLTTKVSSAEGSISSQGTAITAIQNQLQGKASVSALSSLTTEVEDLEGAISAQADALTALNASTDGSGRSSTARFRMTVTDGPNGAGSRIALGARAGSSEQWRAAAIYLDVPVSESEPSSVVLRADKVVIVANGSAGATKKSPFTFSGSQLSLQDLEVNGSLVVNGTIVTAKIGAGAVSDAVSSANPAGTADLADTWVWNGQLTVAHDNQTKVLLNQSFDFNVSGAVSSTASGDAYGEFRILRGSTVIKTVTHHLARKESGTGVPASVQGVTITHIDTPGSGSSTTYTFEVRVTGQNVNTNARNRLQYALAMKR